MPKATKKPTPLLDEAALNVLCPTCGKAPGEGCTTADGRATAIHQSRRHAARSAAETAGWINVIRKAGEESRRGRQAPKQQPAEHHHLVALPTSTTDTPTKLRDLVRRLGLQPEDTGGPSRMDMLRERAEAHEVLSRLLKWAQASNATLRLQCGELSAQEIRTVRAVLAAITSETS